MIAIFPELAACAATRDIERLAVLVRRYFGGEQATKPRPNIAELLRHFGLRVDHLAMQGHGALLATDEQGRFHITAVVARQAEPLAERFLLAHMLGHFLLDIQPLIARGDWQMSGYRESQCPMRRYGSESGALHPNAVEQRELAADQFAAALLMPMGMVRTAFQRFKDEARTAEFFGVDRASLLRRLRDLEVLGNAPVNFLDAEQRGASVGASEGGDALEQKLAYDAIATVPATIAAAVSPAVTAAVRTAGYKASMQKPAEIPQEKPAEPTNLRGMERIRALARKIESERS